MREINVIGFAWRDGLHSPKLEMVAITASNIHQCRLPAGRVELLRDLTLDKRSVRMLIDGAMMIANRCGIREICDALFGSTGAYSQNLEEIGKSFRVYGHVLRQLGIRDDGNWLEDCFKAMLGDSLIEASDVADLESLARIIHWATESDKAAKCFRKACGLPLTYLLSWGILSPDHT